MLGHPAQFAKPVITVNRGVVTAVLLIAVVLGYWPSWAGLIFRWHNDPGTYGHGFIVAVVCVALLVRTPPSRPNLDPVILRVLFAACLLTASTIWMFANFANVLLLQAVLISPIFFFALAIATSFRSAMAAAFPIAYFYFAVPIWGMANSGLQEVTIYVVSWVLSIFDMTAVVVGEYVEIPSGTFRIASGCSGLHFFIVSFALSSLYAYLNLWSRKFQFLFVFVTLGFALLINWIRVTIVIVAGYLTEMKHYLVAVDHYKFGWFLFGTMFVPLYFFARYLEKRESALMVEDEKVEDQGGKFGHVSLNAFLVSVLLLIIMPVSGAVVDRLGKANMSDSLNIEVVRRLGTWQWMKDVVDDDSPRFVGPDVEIAGDYVRRDMKIEMYINRYTSQTQRNELISSDNRMLSGDVYYGTEKSVERIQLTSGADLGVSVVRAISRDGSRRIQKFWYQVGDVSLTSEVSVKLEELKARLKGRSNSGIIVLSMRCNNDCIEQDRILSEFISAHGGDILEAAF